MALELQAVPALRAVAWALLVALGLLVWARRPDAAGRAFAFWAFVWGGGIQLVLAAQEMATDLATQQVLYRAAYYAVLASSPAFLALLLYVPRRAPRATLLLAAALAAAVLGGLAFALDHGAFLAETYEGGYAPANVGAMAFLFPAAVWSGFLAGMLWLGWRAPAMPPAARDAATWIMAGLALFAADRAARTAALGLRDPATLGAPPEGFVYAGFMAAFGLAAAWMAWRTRGLADGANVGFAALVGGAVGATAMVTYGWAGGATTFPVLMSALLAPAYGALVALGVRRASTAPADAAGPADARAAGPADA